MNLLAVSNSHHRARRHHRRTLSAYLHRVGDETYIGRLSQEGERDLVSRLRESATRQSAVTIYRLKAGRWAEVAHIGSRQGMANGAVASGSRPSQHLSPPLSPGFSALADTVMLAGLLHDTGKLLAVFQSMVSGEQKGRVKHRVRHQTASAAFTTALMECGGDLCALPASVALAFPASKRTWALDEASGLLEALVLFHHGLPERSGRADRYRLRDVQGFGADYTGTCEQPDGERIPLDTLINQSARWRALTQRLVSRFVGQRDRLEELQHTAPAFVWHMGRTALMLADHLSSSDTANAPASSPLAKSSPPVSLSAHSLAVGTRIPQVFPLLAGYRRWPRIEAAHTLPGLSALPVKDSPFHWQVRAQHAIGELGLGPHDAFFGVMSAETGTGKTRGGFRVMSALRGGHARFVLGLGLGALARQQGQEYRSEIGLSVDDVAILVGERHGGRAVDRHDEQRSSSFDLDVDDPAQTSHSRPVIAPLEPRARRLLQAPIVVGTIEHVIEAVNADRAAHVTAMVRLMSSDLLLDEVDIFSASDLHAIARLIYLVGLFGNRVVISSATLPPELVEGLFRAYEGGHRQYRQAHSIGRLAAGWFSNSPAATHVEWLADEEAFRACHERIARQAAQTIQERTAAKPKRQLGTIDLGGIVGQPESAVVPSIFEAITDRAVELAEDHHEQTEGRRFSIGVVRFNHVASARRLALWLNQRENQGDWAVRVVSLTARLGTTERQTIEGTLNCVLNRKNEDWWDHPAVRRALQSTDRNVLVIVVTTPIIEVGRDFDFDWAILEPSSHQSIIQSAGRVLRHRHRCLSNTPNVWLLSHSVRHLSGTRGKPYGHPGPGVEHPGNAERLPRREYSLVRGEVSQMPGNAIVDAMGARVFANGIHAGGRIAPQDENTCEADQAERQALREVLLDPDEATGLSLHDFLSEPVPLRDTHYQAMPFRPDDAGQEYETVKKANHRWTSEVVRIEEWDDAAIAAHETHWFILIPWSKRTAVEVTLKKSSAALGFHPQLGWIRSPAEIST